MGIMGMTREMSAGYNVARLITTRGDRAPVTKTPKGGYTNPCTTIGSAVAHWATTATNELLPNRQLWRAGENGDAQFQVENDAYFGQLSQYFVNYFVGAASYLREGGATPSVLGTFFGEVGRDLYHFDWGWEGYGRALLNPKTMYDIVNLLAFSNEREIFEFLGAFVKTIREPVTLETIQKNTGMHSWSGPIIEYKTPTYYIDMEGISSNANLFDERVRANYRINIKAALPFLKFGRGPWEAPRLSLPDSLGTSNDFAISVAGEWVRNVEEDASSKVAVEDGEYGRAIAEVRRRGAQGLAAAAYAAAVVGSSSDYQKAGGLLLIGSTFKDLPYAVFKSKVVGEGDPWSALKGVKFFKPVVLAFLMAGRFLPTPWEPGLADAMGVDRKVPNNSSLWQFMSAANVGEREVNDAMQLLYFFPK